MLSMRRFQEFERTIRSALLMGGPLLSIGAFAIGCTSASGNQTSDPVVVGISETMAPLLESDESTLFQSQTSVMLPLRAPTAEEANLLGPTPPFARAPFYTSADVHVEARFVLSNLGNTAVTVELLVDPWNEFVRYRPNITVGEDEVAIDFSGYDKFFVLPPNSRTSGTVSAEDFKELAIDLATVQNVQATAAADTNQNGLFNRAFNIQNRSIEPDAVLSRYVPSVIPGVVGFDIGIRTFARANVAIEVIVDTIDTTSDRVAREDDPLLPRPTAILSAPPPPMD